MKLLLTTAAQVLAAALVCTPASAQTDNSTVQRGRYLVKIGGCNDCHTAGYTQSAGKVPEAEWLKGDQLGWQGPWGTTYATNLRLSIAPLTEQQWLQKAKTLEARPPMPWFVLREMDDADLRAIYAYLRHAGPAGQPAPASLPPGKPAAGPVVRFPG